MASKTKPKVQLIDNVVELAARKYHAIKINRRNLEASEKTAKEELVTALSKYDGEYEVGTHFNINGIIVKPVSNAGQPRINQDKLLERGVDPEIIGFATSATPYIQYNTEIEGDE